MATLYRPRVIDDLRALAPESRAAAIAAIRVVERDPRPDGVSKREAPSPPFKPGTLVASIAGFIIRYVVAEAGVEFVRVQIAPDV